MNECLKELMLEAGYVAPELASRAHKLAELIVQECIGCIKEWRDASDEQMEADEHWKGYRSGCNDSIVEIQEHFGVK